MKRFVAGAAVALALAMTAGTASGLAATAGPPLPPQPGLTAVAGKPACAMQRPMQSWTPVHVEYDSAFELRVDPGSPCVQYLARTPQAVLRSSDGGSTWQTAFQDSRQAVCAPLVAVCVGGQFAASGLSAPRRGELWLSEAGNGDALVATTDSGHSWSLRNGGLLDGQAVRGVAFAPGSPAVVYALASLGEGLQLLVSQDAGASWLPTTPLPALATASAASVFLQVDPADDAHLALVAGGQLWQSTDRGQTWSLPVDIPNFGSGYQVVQFQLLASRLHPWRLFVVEAPGDSGEGTHQLAYSDNDGQAWAFAPVKAARAGLALAADPARPDTMLYLASTATGVVEAWYSRDGFDTAAPVPGLAGFNAPASPFARPQLLQADGQGAFYLTAAATCGQAAQPGLPACPRGHSMEQALFRLTPIVVSAPVAGGGGAAGSNCGSEQACDLRPVQPMTELKTCVLPHADGYSGSLAFDGVDLLYTRGDEDRDTPDRRWAYPIHRVNARTCADDGTILIRLRRADLESHEPCVTYDPAKFAIDNVTYDPNRDVLWFNLRERIYDYQLYNTGGADSCLFEVTRWAGRRHASSAPAVLPPWFGGCGSGWLAYDEFDDSFWSCSRDNDSGIGALHFSARDGVSLPTCGGTPPWMGSSGNTQVATWSAGGPHRLYVEQEDDTTITLWDTVSCLELARYQHRQFAEAPDENEQMACDPVTFGSANAPVIWISDEHLDVFSSNPQPHGPLGTATAYQLPGGYCPLPTRTRYSGPAAIAAGGAARLCASLAARADGGPLAGQVLQFAVDGTAAGSASTDAGGRACVDYTAGLVPGSRHRVTALFGGDRGYLASLATGPLAVSAPALPGLAVGPRPLTPPPAAPPPAPQPLPQPLGQPGMQLQPAPGGQPAAQAQGQAQAAAEPETQTQPQVAVAAETLEQGSYALSAAAVVGGLAAAMSLMGIGLRWALSEGRAQLAGARTRRFRD